jgi:hypothetical protein
LIYWTVTQLAQNPAVPVIGPGPVPNKLTDTDLAPVGVSAGTTTFAVIVFSNHRYGFPIAMVEQFQFSITGSCLVF